MLHAPTIKQKKSWDLITYQNILNKNFSCDIKLVTKKAKQKKKQSTSCATRRLHDDLHRGSSQNTD